MENKQTAVEWLVKKIELTDFWEEEIQQALEMFEKQIMDAFQEGKWDWNDHLQNFTITKDPKEYYNETYKKDKI